MPEVRQRIATFDNVYGWYLGQYVRILAVRDSAVWETQLLVTSGPGAHWVQASEVTFEVKD